MHYNRCTDRMEFDHDYEAVGMCYSALLEVLSLRCLVFIKPEMVEGVGFVFEEKRVEIPARNEWNKTIKEFDKECLVLLADGWKCEWARKYLNQKYPYEKEENV